MKYLRRWNKFEKDWERVSDDCKFIMSAMLWSKESEWVLWKSGDDLPDQKKSHYWTVYFLNRIPLYSWDSDQICDQWVGTCWLEEVVYLAVDCHIWLKGVVMKDQVTNQSWNEFNENVNKNTTSLLKYRENWNEDSNQSCFLQVRDDFVCLWILQFEMKDEL